MACLQTQNHQSKWNSSVLRKGRWKKNAHTLVRHIQGSIAGQHSARTETSAHKPALSPEITQSQRKTETWQFSSWECAITGHQGRKGHVLYNESDLGRLPGGGEVWLALWNVNLGGKEKRRVYGCNSKRKPVLRATVARKQTCGAFWKDVITAVWQVAQKKKQAQSGRELLQRFS